MAKRKQKQPHLPAGFRLPAGYSFEPPADQAEPQVTIPGYTLYGGSTITDEYDAAGTHFVVCNAHGPLGFRLYGFKRRQGETAYTNVPLPDPVETGRGSGKHHRYSGGMGTIGWKDKEFFYDTMPGFVRFPSHAETEARLSEIEARIAALESDDGPLPKPDWVPLYLGIEAPARVLYRGSYLPEHLDELHELVLRFNKLLAAVNQHYDALKHAGIVAEV